MVPGIHVRLMVGERSLDRDDEQHAAHELARYYKRRAEFISSLGNKCTWCNSVDFLEFHHLDPGDKEFNIGSIWSYSKDKIEKELLKCVLLCKECHDKETAKWWASKAIHNRWRYSKHKCKCVLCKADYKIYRRERYLRRGD